MECHWPVWVTEYWVQFIYNFLLERKLKTKTLSRKLDGNQSWARLTCTSGWAPIRHKKKLLPAAVVSWPWTKIGYKDMHFVLFSFRIVLEPNVSRIQYSYIFKTQISEQTSNMIVSTCSRTSSSDNTTPFSAHSINRSKNATLFFSPNIPETNCGVCVNRCMYKYVFVSVTDSIVFNVQVILQTGRLAEWVSVRYFFNFRWRLWFSNFLGDFRNVGNLIKLTLFLQEFFLLLCQYLIL